MIEWWPLIQILEELCWNALVFLIPFWMFWSTPSYPRNSWSHWGKTKKKCIDWMLGPLCSLREWNLTNVRQIAILGWEIIKIRNLFDYPTSHICRKRQTCLMFWRPFAKTAMWPWPSTSPMNYNSLLQSHQHTVHSTHLWLKYCFANYIWHFIHNWQK